MIYIVPKMNRLKSLLPKWIDPQIRAGREVNGYSALWETILMQQSVSFMLFERKYLSSELVFFLS